MGITETDTTLCHHCARTGPTCCQRTQVHVTRGDIARITADGRSDFYETVPAAMTDDDSLHLDPAWAGTFRNGLRTVLSHRDNGDCVFLEENGCVLALDVRPLVCRLYPYDYTEDCIKGVYGHLCPQAERDNPAFLLAALMMNRTDAEIWRRQLYGELAEDREIVRK